LWLLFAISKLPLTTIILPVYNGAFFLESSIASVLAQDLDFQLHVLDDTSSDTSPDIAQSTGDPRVRYSRNPDHYGLFKTLNRGFLESRSELVKIWAQDDVMLPNSLARFLDFADAHPSAGMIYSDFFSINTRDRRTGKESMYLPQRQRTPEIATPPMSALLFFCFGCLPGNISTVMLRRTAWIRCGGFTEGLQQAQDYEMWLRTSELFNIGFVNQKLIEVRDHAHQLSKVGQRQMTTIEEEEPIYRYCVRRLSGVLRPVEAAAFWRQHRGRQHAHWIARAFLRGDFAAASRGLIALNCYGHLLRQLLFWFVSVNGRFLTGKVEDMFDRTVCAPAFECTLQRPSIGKEASGRLRK
jgi:glycosyltransferase involved in cell wall biosynthesis